jgi:hypothetical protein
MRHRLATWITAIAIGAALGAISCTDLLCHTGAWPFDGQTAVPLDAVITLDIGANRAGAMPAVAPGVTLARVDGAYRPVPFDARWDPETGVVTILPDAPLEPDATYQLRGIEAYDIETPNQPVDLPYAAVHAVFHTFSRPTLLAAARVGDDLVLVTSEPLSAEAVTERLRLRDDADLPIEGTLAGWWGDDPHLWVVTGAGEAVAAHLNGYGDWKTIHSDGTLLLPWYLGEPSCAYEVGGAL